MEPLIMPDLPPQKKRKGRPSLSKLTAIDGKQTDYKDTGRDRVPGLILRVTRTGKKSWSLVARRPGHKNPSRFFLGDFRHLTLTEARTKAHDFKAVLRDGGDPVADKRKRRAEAAAEANAEPDTVRSVSVRFLKHCRNKNRTIGEQERIMGRDVLPAWGDRPLAEIQRRDVLKLLERKADTSPFMANRLLALVRRFFNWAVEVDLLNDNPAAGVKAPHEEKSRERVLRDDELKTVWLAADDMGHPFGPITQLLILTAQRRDEVVAMRWSEISATGKEWVIPGKRTKNEKENRVPLCDTALAIIEAQPTIDGSDFVFPSSRTPTKKPASGLSRAKRRLDDASGVTGWRYHDLRRTAASGMARAKVPPHVVEKILNHVGGTLGGVAGIYNRFGYDAEKRHALETWSAHVEGLVSGDKGDNVVPLKQV
jgi:integrase